MKLTKATREQFVANVMKDLPEPPNFAELIEKKVVEAFVGALPPKVAALWRDPQLRQYVASTQFYHRGAARVQCLIPSTSVNYRYVEDIPGDVKAEVKAIIAEAEAFFAQRDNLRTSLAAIASACTTDTSLASRLPEFAEYIPKPAAGAMLPATTNLITDFMKAGWPKGKK